MKLILHQLPKRCKSLIPLLAAPAALLLSQGQAKAILTYNIFESGGNVVAQTSGSLNLIGATQIGRQGCSFSGLIKDDVLAAAKELTRRQGVSAGQVVSRLLRSALSGETRARPSGVAVVAGFRPFAASDQSLVSNELIDQLRDLEGH